MSAHHCLMTPRAFVTQQTPAASHSHSLAPSLVPSPLPFLSQQNEIAQVEKRVLQYGAGTLLSLLTVGLGIARLIM